MAKVYATRTCCNCGLRDKQPQMKQVVTYREVGKGQSTFSLTTVLGALLGSRLSLRALERGVFNAGERKFKRKIAVWACPSCYPTVKTQAKEPINWLNVSVFLAGAVVVAFLIL